MTEAKATTDWKLPWTGSCRCGRVRLQITAPPLLTMACHCTGCQRMSASAFSLSMSVPSAGFQVIKGEPTIGGLHGPEIRHHHCEHCKSWLFTRVVGMDFFVNVRPTMIDGASEWFVPFIESYTSEKLPWATTPAAHSFDKFPPFEAYEALMKEFAGRVWR
ncbi:MAG: GFA family protein [Polyangiaceae bacterium]